MPVELVMPKLSDTMEEGTILRWLKRVGEQVTRGEVIAEVETDKADMELEASESGVLREIKVSEGESAAVGAVLALVEEKAATASVAPAGAAPPSAAAALGATAVPGGAGGASTPLAGRVAGAVGPVHPPPGVSAGGSGADSAYVRASPVARKIAAERGIDLRFVRGSGPGGRIVKEDVEAAQPRTPPTGAPVGGDTSVGTGVLPAVVAPAGTSAPPGTGVPTSGETPLVAERQELSRMRQSIARRMSEAFRDIPHFYVTTEIDMGEVVHLKAALQASGLYAVPITYTHMILKATALALRHHRRLNASYADGAIELKGEINLGMAVAVEDGLIVPILRHADELSLAAIAGEAQRLVEQARQGRFAREDLSGGTFTVSNMGMLDVEDFAAVINPPQAAILAVGAIRERPVVRAAAVVPGHTMRVTVSCDHRIIDGVVAGRFLGELKRLLENPIVLVLRERSPEYS